MLNLPERDAASRLREYFVQSGYDQERITSLLGGHELPSHRLRNLPRLLARTEGESPLHLLVRWFTLGQAADEAVARRIIPAEVLETMLSAGMLADTGAAFAPQVMLIPWDKHIIACDHARMIEAGTAEDAVLFPNPTTRLLAHFTVRAKSRATLDLGTGCGCEAFLAAAHSELVVATDLNPRAIEFAAFNARLNGIEGIEFLVGDMFEPVRGRRFDLIVSNPPFFVTPGKLRTFSDNPLELDEFCRLLVRAAPAHLEEGGFLQMLCEWVEVTGEPWQERVSRWVEDTGCDALILKGYSEEADRYGHKRIAETTLWSAEEDAALFAEWMRYYRDRQVRSVHGGLIALRKRSGKNWKRVDEFTFKPPAPFGDYVLRLFDNRDAVEGATEEQLLAARFRIAPEVVLDQHLRFEGARWQQESLVLRLNGGLHYTAVLQPLVADFVMRFTGRGTLAEMIAGFAELDGVKPDQVRKECLEITRRLVDRGFLTVERGERPAST